MAPEARARVTRFVRELLGSAQASLLVTEDAGGITGMVCGQLVSPDLWDDRPVYLVDWLYVIPEARRGPQTAVALMRGVVSCALGREACVLRISAEADQPRLQRRYEQEFGFVPERTSYASILKEEGQTL